MTEPVYKSDTDVTVRDDGLLLISRTAFARDYFDYDPGEHVVFGGPTTRGKTTLAFDLLEYQTYPNFPAYIAVSKPRDPVTQSRGEALRYRRVDNWPVPTRLQDMAIFGGQKPRGYIIWPKFGDLNTDMERCAVITNRLLMERYSRGARRKSNGGILVMDDTMVKAKIMGLDNPMVTILAMAGAMDLGLWIFVQKPTDSGRTTVWGYEQSTHLFFTKGGDDRMLTRYVEIIGQNGLLAKSVIPTLQPFQFLYVHKVKNFMCIVDAGESPTTP